MWHTPRKSESTQPVNNEIMTHGTPYRRHKETRPKNSIRLYSTLDES